MTVLPNLSGGNGSGPFAKLVLTGEDEADVVEANGSAPTTTSGSLAVDAADILRDILVLADVASSSACRCAAYISARSPVQFAPSRSVAPATQPACAAVSSSARRAHKASEGAGGGEYSTVTFSVDLVTPRGRETVHEPRPFQPYQSDVVYLKMLALRAVETYRGE